MSKGTPSHHIRIPDKLWQAFRQLAGERGTTASAEIVAFIRRYMQEHDTH